MGACTPFGSFTPNLLLCKPADGELNWGAAFRGNMDILDQGLTAGTYSVRDLVGANDAGAPNTKYGIGGGLVALRNPITGALTLVASVSLQVVDFAVVGANGLDAGAQAASTWYHFYFINNGTLTRGLASTNGPATGPALPTGYLSWAYAGAVYSDGSTHLVPTRMAGRRMWYYAHRAAVTTGAPAVSSEQTVSVAALVPPNASGIMLDGWMTAVSSSVSAFSLQIRFVTGSDAVLLRGLITVAGITGLLSSAFTLPNVGQQFYYLWNMDTGTPSAPSVTIYVAGYEVSNGG